MIPVVIIDDESRARSLLKSLLTEVCPEMQLIGEADGVSTGLELLAKVKPETIFLDIRMKDGDGFDLLDKLPDLSYHVVFVTAYDEYAKTAFRYNAFDYLTKPIDIEELAKLCTQIKKERTKKLTQETLHHLVRSIRSKKIENIRLPMTTEDVYLKLSEVIRLQSDGSYCTFFTGREKSYVIARSLLHYENILPGEMFFRIHQSHLIILHHVFKVLR